MLSEGYNEVLVRWFPSQLIIRRSQESVIYFHVTLMLEFLLVHGPPYTCRLCCTNKLFRRKMRSLVESQVIRWVEIKMWQASGNCSPNFPGWYIAREHSRCKMGGLIDEIKELFFMPVLPKVHDVSSHMFFDPTIFRTQHEFEYPCFKSPLDKNLTSLCEFFNGLCNVLWELLRSCAFYEFVEGSDWVMTKRALKLIELTVCEEQIIRKSFVDQEIIFNGKFLTAPHKMQAIPLYSQVYSRLLEIFPSQLESKILIHEV